MLNPQYMLLEVQQLLSLLNDSLIKMYVTYTFSGVQHYPR